MTMEPDWVRDVLSPARFERYLAKAGGKMDAAIRLYWWNVGISAAFYTPLHVLEMALRNAIHRQLVIQFSRTDWWSAAPLSNSGRRVLTETQHKLSSRSNPCTADNMVAELSFGFWVSLVSSTYDRTLWVPCLHRAFPFYRGRRAHLHRDLHTMLLFRNRIMHHEPIHHRHLEADHRTILRLLDYLSPSMVEELKVYDEVFFVFERRPDRTPPGGVQ